jgi:glycine/betaine/sarcosine/D-proline reductase family selenoprotein B
MADKLRVVHYVNQFFGQIGGEDAASTGIHTESKPIGPGIGLQAALGDRAEIVATIICGDNYIAENLEKVTDDILDIIKSYQPDMFFAGPAFNAGRYGVACGSVCAAVKKALGIPAVTAMYEENPGKEIYATDIFILKSGDNARKMGEETRKMAEFAYKLLDGSLVCDPEKEGFYERGWMVLKKHEDMASKRAVDMLLNKIHGRPFKTEIPMTMQEKAEAPAPIEDLSKATVMLATDGALCPQGNPDNMKTGSSLVFYEYSVEGQDTLTKEEYTCVHGGFDTSYVKEDPNRLVPLDALRVLVKQGLVKMHEAFLSTSGLTTPVTNSISIGKGMVEYVKNHNIDAVILTST